VELRQAVQPQITPDQVLVRVKAAGVCGSDVHMWRERQSWRVKLPLVLGTSSVARSRPLAHV